MKQCATCINGLTTSHPDRTRCEECLSPLIDDGESALKFRKGELYKHWVEGDPRTRLLELQRSGEINIVIGGEGEHEVNANWTMGEAYKHLADTSEACGGLVVKDGLTQLLLMKTYGPSFVIEYMHSKLYKISIRQHIPWWEQE